MKADSDLTGFIYPLLVGLYGLVFLIIYCITVDISSLGYSLGDYLLILGGGLSETIGIVL